MSELVECPDKHRENVIHLFDKVLAIIARYDKRYDDKHGYCYDYLRCYVNYTLIESDFFELVRLKTLDEEELEAVIIEHYNDWIPPIHLVEWLHD